MAEEIIIAGFGGQGILFIGQLLAYAGMLEGKQVSWLPSYGPEMRGGTANSMVCLSTERVRSPLIDYPTALIAFNQPSIDKFINRLRNKGLLIVNNSITELGEVPGDLRVFKVPADNIASELGNRKVVNLIMLGAYLKASAEVSLEAIKKSLLKMIPPERSRMLDLNTKALQAGMEYIQNNYAI